jgi:aryl-alcohol dehydrogenase-like predicted oxidoreductase
MRPSSALGFGCNSLLGPKSRRDGLALLAAAFDEGVRHFDVARSYSSGDAEGVLGEFLVGRRHEVTITTKFGLLPPSGTAARLGWLKPLARRIMRLSPRLRRAIGRRSVRMVQSGMYSPQQAREAFETSLRELNTDHVDVYLAHEATVDDCTDELADFLDNLVQQGRIAAYGVGSNFQRITSIAETRPRFTRIVQFDSNLFSENRSRYLSPQPAAVITHGAIAGVLNSLLERMWQNSSLTRTWSDELSLDVSNTDTIAALLLAHAVRANPGGIVLFSSTRPESLRQNIRAVAENRFSPDQIDRFEQLARCEAPPR